MYNNRKHKDYIKQRLFGLVPEKEHSGKAAQAASGYREGKKSCYGNPPGIAFCAELVIAHKNKKSDIYRKIIN